MQSDQSESQRQFINPLVERMEAVGSRELELSIEDLRHKGRSVIPVYGYPVVGLPAEICEVAREAACSTEFPPSNGLPELREALADVLMERNGVRPDPLREILITSGAMHALHVVMTALLQPADEVLLISPCYFFGGLVTLTGARVVEVRTEEHNGYHLDFDKIRRSVSPATKILVMSSPVNPTGYVYSREDVEQFIAVAEEFDLLLLSDESYDRMVYDGLPHVSPFDYPEGRRRTVLVKSFTKSYALPTWRVGYLVADRALISSFRKVLEWTLLHCPYINQRVALAVLQHPDDWLVAISRQFEARRNQLFNGIRDLKPFSAFRPQGGPFLFLDVSRVDAERGEFARLLLEQFGVPAVPGTCFSHVDHVRIPFGGTEQAVSQLVDALQKAALSRAEPLR
ncbi:MAG TPA: pyridoxal phosphate-dependent aminotransferase [Candidatus Dormibacteraeota bacterium]|nr:pyridoxal phosphate-dependent aminotransferase [Candidatus Dormibacteraeota bacterium]